MAFERPIVEQLTRRPFREAAFARQVKCVYQNRCALTGLALTNGGGRPEVQAAHIRPVEHDGPDSVRNGLALSGTTHWMFDRGLISIDDDYSVLIAEEKVPADTVERLILPEAASSEGAVRSPPSGLPEVSPRADLRQARLTEQ